MQQKMISISSKEMRMHDKTSNWFDTGKTTVLRYQNQSMFKFYILIRHNRGAMYTKGKH